MNRFSRAGQRLQRAVTAMGKGLTIPFTGKGYMKRRTYASARIQDEVPHNWRVFWRARNLTKLNSRDLRRIGESD